MEAKTNQFKCKILSGDYSNQVGIIICYVNEFVQVDINGSIVKVRPEQIRVFRPDSIKVMCDTFAKING